ncbi:lactate utilization protein [Telmatospirillum sp. J64-1]|uniref:LutC/YkgG family protein n=1 Tax=Telmatospirillum sp. J64-1 TaxID=2502183 RepID=UPI0021047190|nr:lactate utilization protein [Telmatospirillum sp. J64-1]
MSSREEILGAIRRSLKRGPLPERRADELRARLAEPRANVLPARALSLGQEGRVALFVEMAQAAAASVARVDSLDEVPAEVARYLAGLNEPPRLVIAPALKELDWESSPLMSVEFRAADAGDGVSVTPAFAGIAETGTLALLSGPDSPTTLNFLPDTHIVVLKAEDITATYEDVWVRLRRLGEGGLPRTVNLITGPSRTGDIELSIQLGAHGPRRLHLVLVGATAP